MVCDDVCSLWLSLTDPMNPEAREKVLNRPAWTTFRNFYHTDNRYNNDTHPENGAIGWMFTKWIPMTKGQKYYM